MPPYRQNWKYRREIFIPAAFFDAGLSDKAFFVCCYLSRCADNHGRTWAHIRQIRDHCHGTPNSIVAAIRELEARGFLQIVRKKPAIYQMTNSDEWKYPMLQNSVTSCYRNLQHDVTGGLRSNPLPEPLKTSVGTPYIGTPLSVPHKEDTHRQGRNSSLPSLQELKNYCAGIGLPESDAEYFGDLWKGNGFTLNGDRIFDWRAVIENRKRSGWCPSQRPAARKQKQNQKRRGL